jgi:hypothetical protein
VCRQSAFYSRHPLELETPPKISRRFVLVPTQEGSRGKKLRDCDLSGITHARTHGPPAPRRRSADYPPFSWQKIARR